MGFTSAQMAQVGMGAAITGSVNSAIGSYYGAKTQKNTLLMQSQAAQADANSSALALTGEAQLESLNAQAVYNASLVGAEFSRLEAEQRASSLRTQAEINSIQASMSAASAEVGAQLDERSAQLNELQAQSIMLRGQQKEQDARMQFAQAKSKATASMAARGLDLGEGAALQVRAGYDLMSENTAIQIQQSVLMYAFGQRVAAMNNQASALSRRQQAASTLNMATLNAGLADAEAQFTQSSADASATAAQALAKAGLLNADARSQYKTTMAGIMKDNASVAAMIRQTTAGGISPAGAAVGSLISGAGQVAQAWYQYSNAKR